ncbi:MAG: DUF1003 domain-containing protein [Nanoarchaeota archaeon]|nr:DUF1003 domain-containing protein [Nanoarchaeota archaeon]
MAKKRNGTVLSFDNGNLIRHAHHPIFRQQLTLGQKAADAVAKFGGSWKFISLFGFYILVWMSLNTWLLSREHFDPFPFILLNLTLSTLAALQAPIILMAQNRQAERDRIEARYDHAVNRKAEREIQRLQKDIDAIKKIIGK